MSEIKCPKCGEVFTVDESSYAEIVNQVRGKEFNEELERRLHDRSEAAASDLKAKLAEKENEFKDKIAEVRETLEKAALDAKEKFDSDIDAKKDEIAERDRKIAELEAKIQADANNQKLALDLAIAKAVKAKDDELAERNNEITDLKGQIEIDKQKAELNRQKQEGIHADAIKRLEEELEKEKNFKLTRNNKMVGEDLEKYCSNEFEKVRSMAFPNAIFVKDTVAVKDEDEDKGTKGDFIFKESIDGIEYISIMFEMKNEMDGTEKGKTNEFHMAKLDKDRKKKECEYAVLVSTLEPDNELYNKGIYDASHKYEKMFVIRPEFFIPMISLLRNAALNSFDYLKKLAEIQNKDIDYQNFEDSMKAFKDDFSKSYKYAENNFEEFSKGIDKAIDELMKIKESLRLTQKQLTTANNKLDKVTIDKLTKDAPSVRAMFEEIRKEKEAAIEEK